MSLAVVSKGEYGVPPGLVFSYPCRSDGQGNYTVVDGVKPATSGPGKYQPTLKELEEQKGLVGDLLKGV